MNWFLPQDHPIPHLAHEANFRYKCKVIFALCLISDRLNPFPWMTSEVRGRPCLLVGWCRLGDRFGVIENPVGLPVPQLRRKASTFFLAHLPRQSHRTKGFASTVTSCRRSPRDLFSMVSGVPYGPIASSLTTRTSLNKRTDQGLSCVLRTTHELAPEGDLLTSLYMESLLDPRPHLATSLDVS